MTRLESMTQACINDRGSTSLQERLRETIELLRVICWCTDAWYLPTCHLAHNSVLFAVVNRVLLWALAYTRQPQQLVTLSEQTEIAVSRVGMLCIRLFQHVPSAALPAAICKLPATLVPALAHFFCERMWSLGTQLRLANAVYSGESIMDWIVPFLGTECTASQRTAMCRVLVCPALLAWARMAFTAMMPNPSPSAAVRLRERANGRQWPPSCANAEQAWQQLVTLEELDSGKSLVSGSGRVTSGTEGLMTCSAVSSLEYLRALRIIARNTPAGMAGSEARRRDRTALGQQHEALVVWLGSRMIMGSVTARRNIEMVLPLAVFLSSTVLHWLRHGDAEGSGMQRELGDVQTMMKEIGVLVQQHHTGMLVWRSCWQAEEVFCVRL